jgi:hypothetical protein
MWPILEPIMAGVLVSLWNKYVLPAICDICHAGEKDDDIVSETSAISSDIEVHVH